MKFLLFLFLVFSFGFLDCQEVHAIYALNKKSNFTNKFKNYTKKDSIILYENKTFRRYSSYWGFDEFDNGVFFGRWKFRKKQLVLQVDRREDSLSFNLDEIQTIKKSYLKKYRKTNLN